MIVRSSLMLQNQMKTQLMNNDPIEETKCESKEQAIIQQKIPDENMVDFQQNK